MLSRVQLLATPWTVARQAPFSMARTLEQVASPFSRGSSNLGIEPRSPTLQSDSLLSEQRKGREAPGLPREAREAPRLPRTSSKTAEKSFLEELGVQALLPFPLCLPQSLL